MTEMTEPPSPSRDATLDLSIVAPAHNEQDNIAGLVEDIDRALSPLDLRFEFIIVNDGSTDTTEQCIAEQMALYPWVRGLRMTQTPQGKGNGQSAAFYAGLRETRAPWIALLDADRQNDPADIPAMLEKQKQTHADMIQGDRSADRQDTWIRRRSSWVGRTFRKNVLGDTIRDTGCSLRVFRRELALKLPLQYRGMHRFIPIYARMLGYQVIEMAVHHRPRAAGEAKYGIWNRALPGLIDLLAVRWMKARLRPTSCEPLPSPPEHVP